MWIPLFSATLLAAVSPAWGLDADAPECGDREGESCHKGLLQKTNKLEEVDVDENWQGVATDIEEARAKNLVHNVEEASTLAPISSSAWTKYIGADVDYKDMQQGGLGDCYFLAALVSIAKARPDIIRGMFTNEELLTGNHPTYTTKWNINGKPTKVAINDMLPAPGNRLAFAAGRGHTYWPSLLEKAWAKIFGDYKTTEGGKQEEVFKAITQAPVVHIDHEEVLSGTDQDNIDAWNKFARGTTNNYIMGASTGHCSGYTKMGITCGHAFAVLGVVALDHYPQVVKIYNPWGKDEYAGVLEDVRNSDKDDGLFYCTWQEFLENFGSWVIAEVQENAVPSSIVLSLETQQTIALEFEMQSNEPFAVQLEWPNKRFLPEGCDLPSPIFTMAVANQKNPEQYELADKSGSFMTNAIARLPGGSGKYTVFVSTRFVNSKSWLKDFVVNVYGPATHIVQSKVKAIDAFLEMQGLCKRIEVPDWGVFTLDEASEVNGLPIFRGVDGTLKYSNAQVLYFLPKKYTYRGGLMYTGTGKNKWRIIDTVANGEAESYFPGSEEAAEKASCSASMLQVDSPTVLPVPAKQEMAKPAIHGSALVDAGVYSNNSLQLEETCGTYVERLSKLGEGTSIASSGQDPMFPESVQSIVRPPQEYCGDSAAGQKESCSVFNHWVSKRTLER